MKSLLSLSLLLSSFLIFYTNAQTSYNTTASANGWLSSNASYTNSLTILHVGNLNGVLKTYLHFSGLPTPRDSITSMILSFETCSSGSCTAGSLALRTAPVSLTVHQCFNSFTETIAQGAQLNCSGTTAASTTTPNTPSSLVSLPITVQNLPYFTNSDSSLTLVLESSSNNYTSIVPRSNAAGPRLTITYLLTTPAIPTAPETASTVYATIPVANAEDDRSSYNDEWDGKAIGIYIGGGLGGLCLIGTGVFLFYSIRRCLARA